MTHTHTHTHRHTHTHASGIRLPAQEVKENPGGVGGGVGRRVCGATGVLFPSTDPRTLPTPPPYHPISPPAPSAPPTIPLLVWSRFTDHITHVMHGRTCYGPRDASQHANELGDGREKIEAER